MISLREIWLLRKLPSIPHFLSVRSLVSTALRGACQVENSPDLVHTYISYLAAHTVDDDLPDLTDLANEISQLVVERSTIIAAILPQPESDNHQARQTLHAFMAIFCNYLEKARSPRGEGYQWSESQDQILVQWSNGEECTMHILVVHAMIILLTYDTSEDDQLFNNLLETWFPLTEPPKAFLVDTSEEALLIPDWLKLRMIRSNVPRLVDAALKDLEPQQLVLFIQSFGIPVSSMSKLLHTLDAGVQIDPSSVGEAVLDKTYMAQLVEVQHRRGATGGLVFVQVLQLLEPQLPDENVVSINKLQQPLPPSTSMQKQSVIQCSVKTDVPHLINRLFIENIPMNQKMEAYRRLHKTLAKDLQRSSFKESGAVVLAIQHICSVLSSMQVKQFLASLVHMSQYSCTLMRVILLPLKRSSTSKHVVELARNMCLNLISLIGDVKAPILSILRDFANVQLTKTPQRAELSIQNRGENPGSILESTDSMNLESVGRKLLDISLKQQKNDVLVETMAKLLVSDSNESALKPRTGLLIDWLASVEPELIGTCPNLQLKLLFGKAKMHINIDKNVVSSHSCRPYILTLLTHRASWATLYKCVGHLLDKYDDG